MWQRDGGRCAFVSASGRRCTEDAFLEFHHVVPYSAGGPATVANIQLRCRAHNTYEAYNVATADLLDRFDAAGIGRELGPARVHSTGTG